MRAAAILQRGSNTISPAQAAEGRQAVVDTHLHVVGDGLSGSGCSMPPHYRESAEYRSMVELLGFRPDEAHEEEILDAVVAAVDSSSSVDYGVLLATDCVFKNGRKVESDRLCSVPNEFVLSGVRRGRRVLFGASVHPYRTVGSMLFELHKSIDHGAVLFHWMLQEQQIDPMDDRCMPFYLALIRANLPLLCHVHAEQPSPHQDARTGLAKLQRPLELGLKVILARDPDESAGQQRESDYAHELIAMLRNADERRWSLFVDLSSCVSATSGRVLPGLQEAIADGSVNSRRILFGSGFPFMGAGSMTDSGLVNIFDRSVEAAKNLHLPEAIFLNAGAVIRTGSA